MPFSQSSQLSAIVGYAEELQPASVLDVGTGMGQYGFLLRTNLEFLNLFDVEKGVQRPRESWRLVIDGIEGFAGYRTPVHDYAYNRLMIGDAMQLLPGISDGAYEMVLAIDILEHLSEADGVHFLGHCRRIASRAAVVSTPKTFVAQDVHANPFENHRSVWSQASLLSAGYTRTLENAESWISVCER